MEHINKIKNIFFPKIEACYQEIDVFRRENEEIRQCVRRFDEDLSLKASKSAMLALSEDCERSYVGLKKWRSIQECIEGLEG